MLQSFIHRLLKGRHFWRYATFSEISELYAARALRMLALNMISAFAAIYLYQSGYSLAFIGFYYAGYFFLRALAVLPLAYVIARFGPKHSILVSNLLYVVALVIFMFVPQLGIIALIGFGIFQSLSAALYELSYEIDFSKVSNHFHAGKELGYMNIVEKIAAGLSPLIGGIIAFLFGPQATIILASVLFAVAAAPLLTTGEPVRTHQHLTFTSFPFRMILRQFIARLATGFDYAVSGSFWHLFIVIVVLGTTSNAMYAQVGAFGSITLFAALIISYVFGKLIDRNRGRELLGYAVILDGLTHIFRPFINAPAGVIATNVINEAATTGYAMPFMRGMFDMADRLAGFRIAYICCLTAALCLGASLAALFLGIATVLWGEVMGLNALFFASGVIVLLIRLHRFPLYRR